MYDIANVSAILIVLIISFRIGLIPLWLLFFLCITAFVPFILNDVLFPITYMPDQRLYTWNVADMRNLDLETLNKIKTGTASLLLALVPLPYVETWQSLGFFNRLIASIIIIWLYASKNIRGWPLLFILFYPSFVLYSSLSLRDMLVLSFMLVSVIFYIENRKFLALLICSPLFIIKFQNFFLMIVFFAIHSFFSKGSILYKFRYLLLILSVAALTPFIMTIIELIDYYRRALFIEDGGLYVNYEHIRNFNEFIILSIQSAPYFFMKPFPWETDNIFQFIQSIENIFLFLFLILLFKKSSRIDKSVTLKWILFLFVSFSIYGLVVYNFGTSVRYKFPFIVVAVIGLAYELYLKHGILLLNKNRSR